jgi:hypothetical protein
MTAADKSVSRIRTGPRWDAVLMAVAEAEDVLESPLADDERDGGWTDELCTSLLASVRRVRDELGSPSDTSVVLEDSSALDAIDPTGDALRMDIIFDVDLVLGELDRAERALHAATALLEDLATPLSPDDEEDGFDEAARDRLLGMLDAQCRVLAAGEYLDAAGMDAWADALRAYGFLRASRAPGLQDDASASGFTKTQIEQFPPGRRWEQVAIFDRWLCNVAATDVLDDDVESDEEREEEDSDGAGDEWQSR